MISEQTISGKDVKDAEREQYQCHMNKIIKMKFISMYQIISLICPCICDINRTRFHLLGRMETKTKFIIMTRKVSSIISKGNKRSWKKKPSQLQNVIRVFA